MKMNNRISRRSFLKSTAMAGALSAIGGGSAATVLTSCSGGSGAGSNAPKALKEPGTYYIPELPDMATDGKELKAGVIGCGGRGSGAAFNFLAAANGVTITALGDTFQERVDELAKKLKDLSRKTPEWFTPKGLLKLFFDLVEFAGQSAELVNRFAAYKTSREMGRSINRSIIDAKEITVNFNRKGAGRKSADPNKSWYSPINVASAVSQYGRASILFWNANMQAKYRLYKNLKEHPVMTSITLMANSMAIGAVAIPLLNNLLLPALYDVLGWSSGDDDEDYYDVLTDWERTHNICIRLPEGYWLKIPLSPEMSPWYSMGDAIFGAASGKRDISATDFVKFTIDAVSPLSMNWSYEGSQFLLNFLPTIGQPPFQNMMNVNFMGNLKIPYGKKKGFKMSKIFAYIRVSTREQNENRQLDALKI